MNKRNLYSINIQESINKNRIQTYKKMKIPKKIIILDIKSHPHETVVAAACSDGHVLHIYL